jgi:hypothetical protein
MVRAALPIEGCFGKHSAKTQLTLLQEMTVLVEAVGSTIAGVEQIVSTGLLLCLFLSS